jgi:hypothetical protein
MVLNEWMKNVWTGIRFGSKLAIKPTSKQIPAHDKNAVSDV